MEWTLDTGALGAAGCDAKDLRTVLERDLLHHAETAPETAAREVMFRLNTELAKTDHKTSLALAELANKARDAVLAKLPSTQDQMRVAIEAACAIADHMGGKVTCTISGHAISDHPAGVFKRMQVFVDRAAPMEEWNDEDA